MSSIRYFRRGGAAVAGMSASWPFGKIEIVDGSVTVRVFGKAKTLHVAEVRRVESLGLLRAEEGPGVRIFFRGKHWEEFVDFYSFSGWGDTLDELKRAGFNVEEEARS